jgi:tetratricopeptide (TPR) repeat protein
VEQTIGEGRSRLLILPVALACGAFLCYQAARLWLADHRIHSSKLEVIESGAALEPGDAEAWDILGRHRQLDFANPDPVQAIADYRRAVNDNPLSANHWMNLAGAYEAIGDLNSAQHAFEQARALYPISAEVAWNYGNFLLRQGQDAAAYAEIRQAVQSDPRLLRLAVSRVWRARHDVNVLLDQVLPADVNAYIQALNFFASIRQTDAALSVWRGLIALDKPVPLQKTFPFFDELILDDRSGDAKKVWTQALAAAGLPYDQSANHSLLWNGSFSRAFDNGGLGWRWDSPWGVGFSFESAPPSCGVRSIRLDFAGGRNLGLAEPAQYVPVEPGRVYHFHAYMRTAEITTESGMRFSIIDPNHDNAVDAQTENFTGSHPWTALDIDVSTGPETHFLLIQLLREESRLFDNKLRGSVWIADVSLVPAEAQGNPPQ